MYKLPLGASVFPPLTAPQAPLAVRMGPLFGFGAEPPKPQVVKLGTGAKFALYSVGALILGGIAWLAYQEVLIKKQIVATGGGEALMKYELGQAAGVAAGGLADAISGRYRKNARKKGKKARHKRSMRRIRHA